MSRTTIITGASSGIGRELARELGRRGHGLGLTGRRLEALDELKREIEGAAASQRIETRRLDVRDASAVHAVIRELAGALGSVDLIVANAGVGGDRRVGDGRFEIDEEVIRTNMIGAMATVDAAVEIFRPLGRGQIVGISSVAAFRGLPGNAAYSASKAGFSTYLDAVRAEVESIGIDVTTISPGFIDTPINNRLKSRPFLVSAAEGARQIADLIERRVRHSTVPVLPWGMVGAMMRNLPDAIWYRAVRSAVPSGSKERT